MKNGNLGNNFYIFQPVLNLTTLSCSAACRCFDCKNLGRSDGAAIICGGCNMTNLWKSYEFSERIAMEKKATSIPGILVYCVLNSYRFSEKMAIKKVNFEKKIV